MFIVRLIKRFISWLKKVFSKKTEIIEIKKNKKKVIKPIIKKSKINFYENIKNGDKFLSDSEYICVRVSKYAYIEFVRILNRPVIACYRNF